MGGHTYSRQENGQFKGFRVAADLLAALAWGRGRGTNGVNDVRREKDMVRTHKVLSGLQLLSLDNYECIFFQTGNVSLKKEG